MGAIELVTQTLDAERLESELPQVVEWLKERGIEDLYVTYGVGSEAPSDQLWKPIPVRTDELPSFVRAAAKSRAFVFGQSDLHIYDARTVIRDDDRTFHLSDTLPRVEFSFCHESDIHASSTDPQFIARVKLAWIGKGIKGHEQGDSEQPRSWVPFGG